MPRPLSRAVNARRTQRLGPTRPARAATRRPTRDVAPRTPPVFGVVIETGGFVRGLSWVGGTQGWPLGLVAGPPSSHGPGGVHGWPSGIVVGPPSSHGPGGL